MGTVYRGLTPVPDDEVLRLYKNRIIPIAYVEGGKNPVILKENWGKKTTIFRLSLTVFLGSQVKDDSIGGFIFSTGNGFTLQCC